MGISLLSAYPVFNASMVNAETQLTRLGANWQLLAELAKCVDESRVNEASISQPCCTAIQISLVDLLKSWGIQPNVVCGHSSGEIAAAYAAGYLGAADAMKVAFWRGETIRNLKIRHPELKGRMIAVGLSTKQAEDYISKVLVSCPGKVVVACINSPKSVTISGDESAIQLLQTSLENEGIFNRLLQVDVAYHSHHMEMIRKEYIATIQDVVPQRPKQTVRMISSVTGGLVQSKDLDAQYWARNMVSPVRFVEALEGALEPLMGAKEGSQPSVEMILEIGPHSALAGPIKQILKENVQNCSEITYHSVLTRNADAIANAVNTAGELHVRGVNICFNAINNQDQMSTQQPLMNMPTYNWEHSMSHWNEGRVSSQYRLRQFPRHDLLGVPSHDSLSTEPTWRNYIRVAELPWLKGHVVLNQVIFPASGYICMALEALHQRTITSGRMWKDVTCQLRQVIVERALLIPDNADGIEIFFSLRPYITSAREQSQDWQEFRVFSVSDQGEATQHCRGLVSADHNTSTDEVEGQREANYYLDATRKTFQIAQASCQSSIEPGQLYSNLSLVGINYTNPFDNLTTVYSGPSGSFCSITVPETKSGMPGEFEQPHTMHPATLDTCFQVAFPALLDANKITSSWVLSSIDEMSISSNICAEPGTVLLAHAKVEKFGRSKERAEIVVGDSSLTEPSLVTIKGLCFTSTMSDSNTSGDPQAGDLCHRVEWGLDTSCTSHQEIAQVCRTGLIDDPTRKQRDTYDLYIQSTIQSVLSSIVPEDEAKMAPHHRKMLNWMHKRSQRVSIKADKKLRAKVESFGIEGQMLVHVSDHLAEILRGQVEPLTVLMKDDLLYRVYSNDSTNRCHFQLENYVRLLQFKNPRLRILEIGAGTASTTIPMLEALAAATQATAGAEVKIDKYVFTDISSGFFEKAQTKLANWQDVVEFKKLDIEKPGSEQGFEEGTFDLIIASNVLHATQSMSNTLKNVRNLLKPGGKLALVEITEDHMTWPMIVGTLPGWWLGAADGRVDSPLLKLPQWDKLLSENGFSGADLKLKDFEMPSEHQVSLIISTATSKVDIEKGSRIHIVRSGPGECIANAISDLIGKLDPSSQIWQSSLDGVEPAETYFIVLLDVMTPFLASCKRERVPKSEGFVCPAERNPLGHQRWCHRVERSRECSHHWSCSYASVGRPLTQYYHA